MSSSLVVHARGEGLLVLNVQSYELLSRQRDAHTADVNCVRWHPTRPDLLASGGDDNEVKLWWVGGGSQP